MKEVPRQTTVMIAGAFDFTLKAAHKPQSTREINGIQTINPAQLELFAFRISAAETDGIARIEDKFEKSPIIRATLQMHQHLMSLVGDEAKLLMLMPKQLLQQQQ